MGRGQVQQLGVHQTTAFRWRHHCLEPSVTVHATALAEWMTPTKPKLWASARGIRVGRGLSSREQRTAVAARQPSGFPSDEQTPIPVLHDRSGNTEDCVPKRSNARDMVPVFGQTLPYNAALCTDARAAQATVEGCKIEHHAVNNARIDGRRGP